MKKNTRSAVKLTGADKAALSQIRKAGYVCMSANGEINLAVSFELKPGRFRRLLERGLLEPSGDVLFEGTVSQTYYPVPCSHLLRGRVGERLSRGAAPHTD